LFVFAILFDELSIAAAVYIPLSAAAVLLLLLLLLVVVVVDMHHCSGVKVYGYCCLSVDCC
jgi:hypothetical protein